MAEWTQELKDEIVSEYEGRNPTPENTTDIIMELADEYDKTPNGIRRILVAAGVYVSKAQTTGATKGKEKSDAPKRINKGEAIDNLKELLTAAGITVEAEIVDKLTGKAAVYFTTVIKQAMEYGK